MKPKLHTQEDHGVSIDQIDKDALYVLDKLRAAGYEAYLVGGSVRDLLLGKKPKDFDISTSAKPEEVKKLFRNSLLIGKRFRLAHIRFGKKILEVSTFRTGDLESEELITRDNVWGSAEEDVLRRDFTINGLYYNSADQTIIDYVKGYPDIQKKHLRTIGKAYVRFKQDPVRMIRLLKFQARFGLSIDKETEQALYECRAEITKSAQARVLEELLRMLESGFSAPFFRLMTERGLMQILLPALADFLESKESSEVFTFLEEADRMWHDPDSPNLRRPVLLSCLIFPMLEQAIKVRFIDREKIPHLGEIQELSGDLIASTFEPFFRLPRRISSQMVSLLTSQYRITPIDKRRNKRIRIPKSAEFHLALTFLEIRSRLEPGLQTTRESWLEAYEKSGPHPKGEAPRRRRRRRRGPKKTG